MSRRSYDTLECFSGNTGVSLQWQHGTREPIYIVGTFLDWDGDGDLDVLRKNLGDQALAGRCFKVREIKNFKHKAIHLLKTVLDSFGVL